MKQQLKKKKISDEIAKNATLSLKRELHYFT